jgi:hypothetical protein
LGAKKKKKVSYKTLVGMINAVFTRRSGHHYTGLKVPSKARSNRQQLSQGNNNEALFFDWHPPIS